MDWLDTVKGHSSQLLGWVGDEILLGLRAGDQLNLVLWDHVAGVLREASVAIDRLG